ncbi:MAG: hypothetical protein IKE85_01490 [Mogibacterium sp.]|nr:hypothetical protein [Mogibacterium sp.]
MKIRILILTLIMVMIPFGFVWADDEDHGEDAHSSSMSSETTGEPAEIEEEPVVEDAPADTEAEAAGDTPADPDPGLIDEDKEGPPDANDEYPVGGLERMPKKISRNAIGIAGGALAVAGIIISLAALRRSRKKNEYKGKHMSQ